jgi:hypothetical protein
MKITEEDLSQAPSVIGKKGRISAEDSNFSQNPYFDYERFITCK